MEKSYFDFIKVTEKWLKGYALMTVISAIFDFFNLVVVLHHFGEAGAEYEEMTILGLVLVFFFCNLYWVGSIWLMHYKFPNYMNKFFKESFFGVGVLVQKKLKEINDNSRMHNRMRIN